jgi:hypothetical protein
MSMPSKPLSRMYLRLFWMNSPREACVSAIVVKSQAIGGSVWAQPPTESSVFKLGLLALSALSSA